eukprot:8847320-Pyramimonas_sp.AAC.1
MIRPIAHGNAFVQFLLWLQGASEWFPSPVCSELRLEALDSSGVDRLSWDLRRHAAGQLSS